MALPIKAVYDTFGKAIAFHEFEPSDTIDSSYITGLITIPIGGLPNQVLTKNSVTDYDYSWNNITVDWGIITGSLINQVDLQLALDGKSIIGHTHPVGDINGTLALITSNVTFEVLSANGDVGNALDQLAQGDHNHDASYSNILHNHDSDYAAIVHQHTKASLTDFIETDYVHTNGIETVNGVKTFSNDIIFEGNITVQGTTVTLSSTDVNIGDNILVLNANVTGTPVQNAGLEINRGSSTASQILWDETLDSWTAGVIGSLVPISLQGHTHASAVPIGGTTGQTIRKNSATDYDISWQSDPSQVWGSITGLVSDQLDLQAALDAKEPVISPKNTAFNKDFGTVAGTVSEGDHIHPGSMVDITMVSIGGQLMATTIDGTRSNKILSINTERYSWGESSISNNDWIRIGNASDSDTGHLMAFDGTIVYVTAHVTDCNGNTKSITLYVNDVPTVTLGTLSGNGQQQFVDTVFDYDFSAGDKLSLRGGGGGTIRDTVIDLHIKHRGL